MRFFISIYIFFSTIGVTAQSINVANSYYNNGDFEKALLSFQSIRQNNPNYAPAILGIARAYRQLDRFDEAFTILKQGTTLLPNDVNISAELGITHHLLKQEKAAALQFQNTFELLDKNPNYASFLGQEFKKYHLLKQAIRSYEVGMRHNPLLNYSYEIGQLYGQLGDLENMFSFYFDTMINKPNYTNIIKRRLDDFINEDPENEANISFRKTLLKKNQQEPNIIYNEFLSWLFVQQKQFRKAFAQERAIYKKTDTGIPQLISLAKTAKESNDKETAIEILNFVIENTEVEGYLVTAHRELLRMEIENRNAKTYSKIAVDYERLIETYGKNPKTISLLLDYGKFVGFYQNDISKSTKFLKSLLKERMNQQDKARIEILMGDLFVLENKFNKALIYYTRAQKKTENNPIGQEARFKVAKASYYKGDFYWAKSQLHVLKTATSQLIANDAMQLAILIDDNTKEDTTHNALKLFAKADLLKFQEQPDKAFEVYNEILKNHRNSSIEDEALLEQAKMLVGRNEAEKAINNLQKIIDFFPDSFLLDDVYYMLGTIYLNQNKENEAKAAFEQIIFNHADSIYFVEARKKYRKLRGDEVYN